MQIRPIAIRSNQNVSINKNKSLLFQEKQDSLSYETIFVNKKPLIARGIIPLDKDINTFFEEISTQIFPDSNIHHSLSNLLKMGYSFFEYVIFVFKRFECLIVFLGIFLIVISMNKIIYFVNNICRRKV
jgi:hypothetical protein